VKALKEEIGLPVHFHTHDTSGIAAASVLAAVEAGADAVDGAIDAMSGLTSQPNLGSIIEAIMAQLDLVAQSQQILKYFLGLIQFAIISVTLFALAKWFKAVSLEFQSTYSGLLFVALFFNSQAGFVYRAQLPLNMAVQALRQIQM